MFSRLASSLSLAAVIAAGAIFANPALAQDIPPAALSLIAANGDTLDYTAGDASLYISTSVAYGDVPAATELSLSLSTITPMDANILKWAAQTGGKSKDYDLVLTTTLSDAEGEEREVKYEISGAVVTSFSTSISTYASPSLSVSLTGGKLVIDGVPMN